MTDEEVNPFPRSDGPFVNSVSADKVSPSGARWNAAQLPLWRESNISSADDISPPAAQWNSSRLPLWRDETYQVAAPVPAPLWIPVPGPIRPPTTSGNYSLNPQYLHGAASSIPSTSLPGPFKTYIARKIFALPDNKRPNPKINAPCPVCRGSRIFKRQRALESHIADKHADGRNNVGWYEYRASNLNTVASAPLMVPERVEDHHWGGNPERMEEQRGRGNHIGVEQVNEGTNAGLYLTEEDEVALAERLLGGLDISGGSSTPASTRSEEPPSQPPQLTPPKAAPVRANPNSKPVIRKSKFHCATCNRNFPFQGALTCHMQSVHNLHIGKKQRKKGKKKGMVITKGAIVLGEGGTVPLAPVQP